MDVTVPQLGESIVEAVVGQWKKNEGDAVAADEPVVVLETDKVTIDVQAPAAGAITKILYPSGSKVKIGDVLATIAQGAAGKAASPAPSTGAAATATASVQAPVIDRPAPTP